MEPLAPFWRKVMEQPEQEKACSMVDALAERHTRDPKVILAHRLVAPLLMEREAISSFVEETHQGALRASLPEVTSMGEAIFLASSEYRLTPSQQRLLREVLSASMRATKPEQPSAAPSA